MQRVVVMGAHGTVGTAFCDALRPNCVELLRWQRSQIALHDFTNVKANLEVFNPDAVFNFAIGPDGKAGEAINFELPLRLATWAEELGFQFIQTSSVMVFGSHQEGPFKVDTTPFPDTAYGKQKLRMEASLKGTSARVVRLGWQIGVRPGGNQMIDFLERENCAGGIKASEKWYPSCSDLLDTAIMLYDLPTKAPGLYQWNTNREQSFYNIVMSLKERLGYRHWQITRDNTLKGNQLMEDNRLKSGSSFACSGSRD